MMRISEIEIIKYPNDEFLTSVLPLRYEDRKHKLKPLGQIDKYELLGSSEAAGELAEKQFLLMDKGQPISLTTLRKSHVEKIFLGPNCWTVTSLYLLPQYRGKGIIKKLYQYILDQGIKILSDTSHTELSRNLWKSFLRTHKLYTFRPINHLNRIRTDQEFDSAYQSDLRLLLTN